MTTAPDETWVVGVVGAGTMGAGIAQVAATGGHRTLLLDAREGAAAGAVAGIASRLGRSVERGRLTASSAAETVARLQVVADLGDLACCDLVVEAVVEDLAVKQALLTELEAVVRPHAVLASNTSSLSVDDLAAGLQHPSRVAGLHFFAPAPLMRLVEVVRGAATPPAVVQQLAALAEAWGKVPVTCTSTPGFVVNRVARPYYGEAFRLLSSTPDLAPATVDALLREAGGFPMGPLELTDLIGQDVNAAVNRSIWHATGQDPRYTPSPVQDALVAVGRLGRKTGAGFYQHGEDAVEPGPATVAGVPGPLRWRVHPSVRALATRAGIDEDAIDGGAGQGRVLLRLTDGRTAAEVEAVAGLPTVLLDLVRDAGTCTRVGAVASPGCPPGTLEALAAVLATAGVAVSPLPDTPGLVVARTAACLVAAAQDAVESGVATGDDVDLAMENGAGHPRGPLAWGEALGHPWVVGVLDALQAAEPTAQPSGQAGGPTARASGRYRVCPTLRGRAMLALHRESGDVLVAHATERARYGRNGVYDITVTRDDGTLVAEVRGRTRTTGGPVPATPPED